MYQKASIQIVYDCSRDKIFLIKAPIIKAYFVGKLQSIDVRAYFKNAYSSGCALIKFDISKVIDNNKNQIDFSEYSNLFSLSSLGIFNTSSQANITFQNYRIFIQAYNTLIWSEDSSYLIDLTMSPLPYKISDSSQIPCTWKIKSIDKFGLVTI